MNGHDLVALGITGKEIGTTLMDLLDKVLEEELPNNPAALLQYVLENNGIQKEKL